MLITQMNILKVCSPPQRACLRLLHSALMPVVHNLNVTRTMRAFKNVKTMAKRLADGPNCKLQPASRSTSVSAADWAHILMMNCLSTTAVIGETNRYLPDVRGDGYKLGEGGCFTRVER